MNPKRKQIIMSEIKYWKQNKLLPAHYCDFLITLYAQGEEENEGEAVNLDSVLIKENKQINIRILLFTLLSAFVGASLFIFTNYPVVTLGVAGAVVVIFLLYAMRAKITKTKIAPFLYIFSAFILLIMSLKLWLVFFVDETILLTALLILNCTLWLFAGRLLKLLYFTISGVMGILVIITFIIIQL